MTESTFLFFVGVDLGSERHQVQAIDAQGKELAGRSVEHGGAGVRDLLEWLAQVTQGAHAERVAIAMEVPRGAIIDALLERGYSVFSINPKQLDRFRDRFSMAGAKDDRRDARVLAHSVRTDGPHFRRLHSDDPRIVRIRELSRGEEALGQDLRRHANQLWSFLQRYFPAVLRLCPGADEPWAWALLRRCRALPSRAARLHPDTVRDVLRQHRIRRLSAEQVCETMRQPLPLAPGVEAAIAEQVLLLLPQLELLHRQGLQFQHRLEALLEELTVDQNFAEHGSLAILRSLPGFGRVCTATVLAEAFPLLAEKNYRALRALCGVAPVTKESGKTRVVSMRRACHNRLRNAMFHAAQVHSHHDPRAQQLYARLRHRRCTHARAVRGVADRMLALLCTLLEKQTRYNAACRGLAEAQCA